VLIWCYDFPCLSVLLFFINALLLLGVKLVVVLELFHFLHLLEELKLFGHRVEVIIFCSVPVEVATIISGVC